MREDRTVGAKGGEPTFAALFTNGSSAQGVDFAKPPIPFISIEHLRAM